MFGCATESFASLGAALRPSGMLLRAVRPGLHTLLPPVGAVGCLLPLRCNPLLYMLHGDYHIWKLCWSCQLQLHSQLSCAQSISPVRKQPRHSLLHQQLLLHLDSGEVLLAAPAGHKQSRQTSSTAPTVSSLLQPAPGVPYLWSLPATRPCNSCLVPKLFDTHPDCPTQML